MTRSRFPTARSVAAACSAALLVAAVHAADAPTLEGRWAGGIQTPGDFISMSITVEPDGDGWRAVTGFLNQGRSHQTTRVIKHDDGLRFEVLNADGSVDGVVEAEPERIDGVDVLRGDVWETDQPDRRARILMVRTIALDPATVDSLVGAYETPDGERLELARLPQATDTDILTATLPRVGVSRTLFPVAEDRFIIGPDFESPWPAAATIEIERAVDDGPTIRWRDERGERTAAPVKLEIDPAEIDATVASIRAEFKVAGVAVGVVHGDRLVYAEGFGVMNRSTGVSTTPATLYQIASVTKTFTATILMILRDEGVVRLDDPVRMYLPPHVRLPATGATGDAEITLRHLATHTSGLRLQPTNYVYVGRQNHNYTPEQLYQCLAESSLIFPAGSGWSYSNLGYVLLSHVLANAAGMSYEDLLRTRIFEPLGMHESAVNLTREQLSRLAVHYWDDAPETPADPWLPGEIAGQGGVTSNIHDMAQYMSMQLRAHRASAGPIRGASLRETQQMRYSRPGTDGGFGLGWFTVHDGPNGAFIFHSGFNGGHSSYVAISPDRQVGVCVLMNAGWAPATRLGERLTELVFDAAAP